MNERVRRNEDIKIRLSVIERIALDSLARLELTSPSEVMRTLLRREALARGMWPLDDPAERTG